MKVTLVVGIAENGVIGRDGGLPWRLSTDMKRFKAALDSRKHKARVDKDIEIAKKVGIAGTPAFTVNGYFVNGAQPFQQFDKAIKLALKE